VVEVIGGAVDEVRIALDRQALSDNGVSYEQGAGSLQANNVILPSGQLANGGSTTPIETISLLTNLDTIKAFGVATADGSTVRLDELAEVELVPGTPVGYSRTDGQPPVSIQVTKEKAANTVSVANRVTAALEELEPTLPNGASTSIFEDQAEYITDSINSLIEEGIIGGVLAVVVVFLFLRNWRTTIIIALSIPLSLIAADLGRVVIGGLFTSTLLTLLVIPVVYSLVDGLKVRIARRRTAHVAVETALREKQLVS
jgi:HAE1 family hydrophobic/amphiphilic exporter-1